MLVAVVGHVEWVTFVQVENVPVAGGIEHGIETWSGAGGAGGVGAVQLAKLAGSCDLFIALGPDEPGDGARSELTAAGVHLHTALREEPTRRAVCLIDRTGERTITTLGRRLEAHGSDPLPWESLDRADAVYVTAGDVEAIRHARRARVLVVSTRHLPRLAESGVRADAVVGSASDPRERYDPAALAQAPPSLVVLTEGAKGGRYETADGTTGRYAPAPLPGEIVDVYGSGDSFHAGLTFGLGAGMPLMEALSLAARCGAAAVTGRAPAGGQLTAADVVR